MAQLLAAEVAEKYQVAVRTVHRRVKAGHLKPARKLPGLRGAYLFDEEEAERAFSGAKQQPDGEAAA